MQFFSQNKRKLANNYVSNGSFKYDFFSLFPLDLLYLWLGKEYTIVRLPRFLKFGDFQEFFRRLGKNFYKHILSISSSRFTYLDINPRHFSNFVHNEIFLSKSIDEWWVNNEISLTVSHENCFPLFPHSHNKNTFCQQISQFSLNNLDS